MCAQAGVRAAVCARVYCSVRTCVHVCWYARMRACIRVCVCCAFTPVSVLACACARTRHAQADPFIDCCSHSCGLRCRLVCRGSALPSALCTPALLHFTPSRVPRPSAPCPLPPPYGASLKGNHSLIHHTSTVCTRLRCLRALPPPCTAFSKEPMRPPDLDSTPRPAQGSAALTRALLTMHWTLHPARPAPPLHTGSTTPRWTRSRRRMRAMGP